MEKEVIYSNGISYYPFSSLGYYVQRPVWEEGREGWEAERVAQPAACQRAEERRQTSGTRKGVPVVVAGGGGGRFCLWFVWDLSANFWLMSRKRCPHRSVSSSPDIRLTTRALPPPFPFLLCSDVFFMSFRASPPYFRWSSHRTRLKANWVMRRWRLQTSGKFTPVPATQSLFREGTQQWSHPHHHHHPRIADISIVPMRCQVSIFLTWTDRTVSFSAPCMS